MTRLPDPAEEPTLTVERAGQFLGLGKTKAYTEAQRYLRTNGAEGLPAIRFGRTIRVPTAALRRLVGLDALDPERDDAPPASGASVLNFAKSPRTSHDVRSR